MSSLVSSLIRILILSDQGPIPMTSFNLITSLLLMQPHWWLELQHTDGKRTQLDL